MGSFKYDGMTVQFDDRLLAHLQLIIVQKLRRQESFLLSWRDADDLDGGRTSIWLQPGAIFTIHYSTNDDPGIDRAWLERLMSLANSPRGLFASDVNGDAVTANGLDLNS